jgi:hypothetical protein
MLELRRDDGLGEVVPYMAGSWRILNAEKEYSMSLTDNFRKMDRCPDSKLSTGSF